MRAMYHEKDYKEVYENVFAVARKHHLLSNPVHMDFVHGVMQYEQHEASWEQKHEYQEELDKEVKEMRRVQADLELSTFDVLKEGVANTLSVPRIKLSVNHKKAQRLEEHLEAIQDYVRDVAITDSMLKRLSVNDRAGMFDIVRQSLSIGLEENAEISASVAQEKDLLQSGLDENYKVYLLQDSR